MPLLPCSPPTECPPNKDFIFCSPVQSQRLSLQLSPSIINLSGMRQGPVEAGSFQHQGGGEAVLLQEGGDSHLLQSVCMHVRACLLCMHVHVSSLLPSSRAPARCLLTSFTLKRRALRGRTLSSACSPLSLDSGSHSTAALGYQCVSCFWTTGPTPWQPTPRGGGPARHHLHLPEWLLLGHRNVETKQLFLGQEKKALIL